MYTLLNTTITKKAAEPNKGTQFAYREKNDACFWGGMTIITVS
jgi:hypothetical protein